MGIPKVLQVEGKGRKAKFSRETHGLHLGGGRLPETEPPAPPPDETTPPATSRMTILIPLIPLIISNPVARLCTDPFTVTWSSPNSRCGCTSTFNQARRRDPNAVQCLPPANHGRVACENTGAASSRCKIICDDGFQLTSDERDCIATARNETKSEFDCSADAENPGFLTADPALGCICADARTENFCGGHREVKCQVNCSEGFTATDQTTCEVVEVEGETVTMAGTTTPRDDFESPCTGKVIALPGKRGCLCATEVPVGAEECTGVGPKEYAICGYVRGEADPAFCATNCIRNTFRRGPQQRCT
ncbi:hypothetical protein B0H13DRAFT_1878750 [Mycena leptocephala]|nr:hypothetical protein B0H13DRAFT_1878750 [Mycena leptocephala]